MHGVVPASFVSTELIVVEVNTKNSQDKKEHENDKTIHQTIHQAIHTNTKASTNDDLILHTNTKYNRIILYFLFTMLVILAVVLIAVLPARHTTPTPTLTPAPAPAPAPTAATTSSPLKTFQHQVLATLTGHVALQSGWMLTERYTKRSRLETVQYLETQLIELGLQPIRQEYSTSGINLYAVLPSNVKVKVKVKAPLDPAKTRTVVLGAHYDTVADSPGANDNASGIALVLGAVFELLRQEELLHQNRRAMDVMIVFFDEEEIGLKGSQAFANMLSGDEDIDVESVHTVDQIGWDSNNDNSFELELPYLGAYEMYVRAAAKVLGAGDIVHLSEVAATDHASFRSVGYRSVGVTEMYVHGDTTPHYHQKTDVFDTVNFEYVESVTLTVVEVLKEIIMVIT